MTKQRKFSMLAFILSMVVISAAARTQIIDCPLKENEVFYEIEKSSVPHTSLELYTRDNMANYQLLTNETTVRESNYNPAKRTVIAVHGYYGTPTSLYLLKSAYLRHEDCNFIVVNWNEGASQPNHTIVVRNVAIVARFIANSMELLKTLTGCQFRNFHLIGWSLGGQLVGFIGKYVKSEKVGRITALDPAGICFVGFSTQHRLHISDADFVDVIMTNAGSLILNEPTGHLTFAPDGGSMARACGNIYTGREKEISIPLDDCSHVRAVELFTSSLGNSQCLFVGYACSDYSTYESGDCFNCGDDGRNCAAMGIHAEKYASKTTNKTVMMYLDTTFADTFCLFQYHIEVKLSNVSRGRKAFGVMYLFFNRGEHDEVELLLHPSAQEVKRPEQLNPGEIYTYLVQSHVGPESIAVKTVHFLWVSYQSQEDSELYVQCVTIIPMNNLQTNRKSITMYAAGSYEPIKPDTMTSLYITYNC